MIADRIEVGFQRARTLGRRFLAEELVQIVRGMREIRPHCDRHLAVPQAPVRCRRSSGTQRSPQSRPLRDSPRARG